MLLGELSVMRSLTLFFTRLIAISVMSLFVVSCAQVPASESEEAEKTVINKSDIGASNQGVTVHTEEELRRTGETDPAKALKRRDPRIN
jgi:hypothetical protein